MPALAAQPLAAAAVARRRRLGAAQLSAPAQPLLRVARAPASARSSSRRGGVAVMASAGESSIGLCGLAVMGQNLALNIAEKGFSISVYNRSSNKTDDAVRRAKKEGTRLRARRRQPHARLGRGAAVPPN